MCNKEYETKSGNLAQAVPSDQEFDWGRVNWLVNPASLDDSRASVGHIMFFPGQSDLEHRHFGEEQILYVISGQGSHVVNGSKAAFKSGDTLYLPPFSRHQVINDSGSELHILGVYIPARFQAPAKEHLEYLRDDETGGLLSLTDPEVIKEQLNKLALAMGQSIRLISPDGSTLIASDNLPPLCRSLGMRKNHCRLHLKKAIDGIAASTATHTFHCCGKVTSIIIPVIHGSSISGYLKCGEFFFNAADREATKLYLAGLKIEGETGSPDRPAEILEELTVDKLNMVYTAASNALEVARHIAELSMSVARQKKHEEYKVSLMEGRMAEARLKEALKEADLKLLQSQLNPHFLFNTLNTISHMAYLDGARGVSDLVCGLSSLLKAALGKVQSLIPLSEELELLRQYLDIQKARFGDRLETSTKIESRLAGFMIPALTLQPIVENAIIHGLESSLEPCSIDIAARRDRSGLVVLTVDNDGPPIENINENAWGVGLNSVKARLLHHYNNTFSFKLLNKPQGGGVRAEIKFFNKSY